MTEHDEVPTVPTHAEVEETRQAARDLVEQIAVDEPRRIESIAKAAGESVAKRVSRRTILVVLVVALLVPLLVSVAALNTSLQTADDVQVALERLDQANDTLAARGQPPVVVPPDSSPEQVSAAAITAQVVASLPETPTADEVASRLQGAVIGQLTGPTFNELARLSADYFRTLPAPPGPTEAQIQAAVDRRWAADPPDPGRDGEKGAPGEPCLPTNPECVGPKGDPGDAGKDGVDGAPGVDGRSIVSGPLPVRENGVCVWRTEYDRAPLFEVHPAGDSACPPALPPVTETPAPPTG